MFQIDYYINDAREALKRKLGGVSVGTASIHNQGPGEENASTGCCDENRIAGTGGASTPLVGQMSKVVALTSGGGVAGSRATRPTLATFRGVDKVFANHVTALSGLDLEIRSGEFLSLLGPSGCAKSTVLRLLSGLTSA